MNKKTINVIGIFLIMLIIFLFSSQDYYDTMKFSDFFSDKIVNGVEANGTIFNALSQKIDGSIYSTENKDSNSNSADTSIQKVQRKIKAVSVRFVRKFAHMFLYGLLGSLIWILLRKHEFSQAKSLVIALSVSFLYGASDEWHQKFVDGRTSQFSDVLFDTLGAFIAICLLQLILSIYHRKKAQKNSIS